MSGMVEIGFEAVAFFALGGLIGYLLGRILKLVVALFLLILLLGILGLAFFQFDFWGLLDSVKPLLTAFYSFITSRVETLLGFIIGLIVSLVR